METRYYNVNVTWNRERKGVMCSSELKFGSTQNGCIEVATPNQFPKGIAGILSPEHLFTAAVASCFMTTFLAVAENSNLGFKSFSCLARGTLDQLDNGPMMTEAELFPSVTLYDEADRDRALRILDKTESACLISNSIKTHVTIHPSIKIFMKSTWQ